MIHSRQQDRSNVRQHWSVAASLLLTIAVGIALAHEGHAPLPTSGTDVDLAKGQITLSAEARRALDVQTGEVGGDPAPETILAYATLVAPWQNHAFAISRLPGTIAALHVRPGQTVQAGDVLAEVRSPDLEQLRLEVSSARNDLRQAERVMTALKASEGVVAAQQLLDAEVQLRQSRLALDLSQAKWRALGLSSENPDKAATSPALPIRALVSGTIIHSDLALGKVVEPGEHLFEIVNLSTVWAKIGVLEKDLGRVSVGQAVNLQLTAYPKETFSGTINVVGSALDPTTSLNTVWAELANPAGLEPRLLPGMSGQARLALPIPTGTKTIPAAALINDGVDRFVLVESANAADRSEYQKKSVTVIREGGGVAVIHSPDLFLGDRVVTRGSHELGGLFAPGIVRLTPETIQTIGLTLAPVSMHSIAEIVDVPGAVELPPNRRPVASAPLTGTLVAIKVDRGQKVEAGQVLAEVFSLDFLNLQLDLLRQELSSVLLSDQLVKFRSVPESVSRSKVDELEASAIDSANKRDSLRRRLTLLGLTPAQLDALRTRQEIVPAVPVRASIGGLIVNFDKVLGQSLRADESLFEVHDPKQALVQGFVAEQDIARVRLGQSARVRLTSDPTTVLVGKVIRSGRTFDVANRTLSIWVELDHEPSTAMRQNQKARISLTHRDYPPTLAVPIAAVAREGTQAFVFVATTTGTFDRRNVILGRADDRHVEVRSGLKSGETIAITAAVELQTAYAAVR